MNLSVGYGSMICGVVYLGIWKFGVFSLVRFRL